MKSILNLGKKTVAEREKEETVIPIYKNIIFLIIITKGTKWLERERRETDRERERVGTVLFLLLRLLFARLSWIVYLPPSL